MRPCEFVEMDKHAHKMIVAFIIAKAHEEKGLLINWTHIINGGVFELLRRINLTDIKAPFYIDIKKRYPEEYKKLNNNVYDTYAPILPDSLVEDFKKYIIDATYMDDLSNDILKFSHNYTSKWEFDKIKTTNPDGYRVNEINTELEDKINSYNKLEGVSLLFTSKLKDFSDLCGQMRFQVRWGHIPRIPNTSVLGHMLSVAIYSYLFSIAEPTISKCNKRLYNNFFGGLFHDLPEAVTRDIISPVKGVIGDDQIKNLENVYVEREIFPMLDPLRLKNEIKYFTQDEFSNKVINNGDILQKVSFEDMNKKYNSDKFSPIDGEVIRLADKLSAFIEAYESNKYGIKSDTTTRAILDMKEQYNETKLCDFGLLFKDFD